MFAHTVVSVRFNMSFRTNGTRVIRIINAVNNAKYAQG